MANKSGTVIKKYRATFDVPLPESLNKVELKRDYVAC